MKIQAENRFAVTRDLFYEGMRRISRDGYGKVAGKAMLIFGGIWLALFAVTLLTGGNLSYVFFCLFVIALVCIWLFLWTPRKNAKTAWQTLSGRYGDAPQRITRFYEDHLEISGDCADKTVMYSDITQIRQTDHLLILLCRDKVGIMVALDGFTKGDLHTVHALIGGEKIRN